MASEDVVHFKDSTFQTEVLKSDLPVLVDFWAVWCGPCKAIAPVVDELATQYKGKVKIGKMDVDHEQTVPQQFGIRSIPTLLVFKGGRVVDTIIGAVSKSKIEESLKKAMDSAALRQPMRTRPAAPDEGGRARQFTNRRIEMSTSSPRHRKIVITDDPP